MNPTKAEKELWGRMAAHGCVACRVDGVINTHVSIHHIDGRTKPGAHSLVLPLCYEHHQGGPLAVHPWKARFEARFGKQRDLLENLLEQIANNPCRNRCVKE